MDKTFRLLLIAAIIIAISMGLSAFKKSKSADSVTNDAQVMVDGQQTYKMSEKVEPVTPADTKNLEKRDGKLDADAADTAENMDKKVSEPKSEHQDDSEANKESDKQVVAQQQSNRIIAYHHENGMVDTNHADEQDHVADNHADEQDHVADNHADEQDHVADNHAKDQIIADGDDKDLDED
jgi:hypothetical protein